jgi:hypothetical protein
MPGGVGGVAPRGVPLSRSRAPSRRRRASVNFRFCAGNFRFCAGFPTPAMRRRATGFGGRRRKSAKARNHGGSRHRRRRGLYGDLAAASGRARLDRSGRLGRRGLVTGIGIAKPRRDATKVTAPPGMCGTDPRDQPVLDMVGSSLDSPLEEVGFELPVPRA